MEQDERIKKLERLHWLTSHLVYWTAISGLFIVSAIINFIFGGFGSQYGQIQVLIGGCMVVARILWVRKIKKSLAELGLSDGYSK